MILREKKRRRQTVVRRVIAVLHSRGHSNAISQLLMKVLFPQALVNASRFRNNFARLEIDGRRKRAAPRKWTVDNASRWSDTDVH